VEKSKGGKSKKKEGKTQERGPPKLRTRVRQRGHERQLDRGHASRLQLKKWGKVKPRGLLYQITVEGGGWFRQVITLSLVHRNSERKTEGRTKRKAKNHPDQKDEEGENKGKALAEADIKGVSEELGVHTISSASQG